MSQRHFSKSSGNARTAQQTTNHQQPAAPALVPAPHTALQQHPQQQWRLELFFKSQQELQAQLPFLQSHGITRVNLTNKSNDDQLLQSASFLQANVPGLDLCVHYSLKYNYCRSPAATLAKLQEFHRELQQVFLQGQQEDAKGAIRLQQQQQCHILLVSGGGKKKAFDTVAALQQLAQQQQLVSSAPQPTSKRQRTSAPSPAPFNSSSSSRQPGFAVAFNPYLPDEAAAAEEVSRLKAKLQTGLVGRVYLQVGLLHKFELMPGLL
jgi:ATP-dependent exoDNAse (exonuclease V) beta subunit